MDAIIYNYFKKMSVAMLSIVLLSCSETELKEDISTDHLAGIGAVQEVNAQVVQFDLSYDVPEGYKVAFEVYVINPFKIEGGVLVKKEDCSPILTGITDGKGQYQMSRMISEKVKDLYVYTSYAGVPALLYGEIVNGVVTPYEVDLTSESANGSVETKATSVYPYTTLGSWNYLGKPDYISKTEKINSKLLRTINSTFPEWKKAKADYIQCADIHINTSTELYISMVSEGSFFDNVLGYFTYEGDITKVDPNTIKEYVAFPRANIIQLLPGGLKAGEMVKLKYYDATGASFDKFPAGTSIGWILRSDGYNVFNRTIGQGFFRFYSYSEWNPEKTNKDHTVVFAQDKNVIIGFEDLPNEWLGLLKGDSDCNDVVFKVTAQNPDAITYGMKEINEPEEEDIVTTEEVDGIQPLANLIAVPANDEFWEDLLVATSSTLIRSSSSSNSNTYPDIIGIHEEFIIANSETMKSLIVVDGSKYRTFVKTTIRKIDGEEAATKAEEKKPFVKTTIRRCSIDMDDTAEYSMRSSSTTVNGTPQSEVAEAIIDYINASKDKLEDNKTIRVIVEMEFDPVPENIFLNELPLAPYTLFIGE